MEITNKKFLLLLLGSSGLRTFTDTFVTGLLFAYSLKFANEGIAASTSSLMLLLIFIFSPLAGTLIDKKIFTPTISGGLYMATGLLMPLFLLAFNYAIFFSNLVFLIIFNIPAALYLQSWSSMIFKGKPATGYAILASTNTFFGICGTIIGSFLVQNNIIWFWVDFKFFSSILVGLALILVFKSVDEKIFGPAKKPQIANGSNLILKNPQITSLENKGIFTSNLINYRLFRESILKKIAKVDRYVLLFSICIAFFAISRTFFLTNVAFTVFDIFNKDIFLYSIVINTAALTAFVFYPFNGRIADYFGNWNYYVIGVSLTPLYLLSFLIFTNDIILIILWALPMGVITEVSQIGIISKMTKPEVRNSAIGLITSSSALGSVIGAFLLSLAVSNTILMSFLLISSILIPFMILFPLVLIRKRRIYQLSPSKLTD